MAAAADVTTPAPPRGGGRHGSPRRVRGARAGPRVRSEGRGRVRAVTARPFIRPPAAGAAGACALRPGPWSPWLCSVPVRFPLSGPLGAGALPVGVRLKGAAQPHPVAALEREPGYCREGSPPWRCRPLLSPCAGSSRGTGRAGSPPAKRLLRGREAMFLRACAAPQCLWFSLQLMHIGISEARAKRLVPGSLQ